MIETSICVAGSARTFASPYRLENWIENFLKSFSLHHLSLFLLLKTSDSDKFGFGMGDRFHAHQSVNVKNITNSLKTPFIYKFLKKARIVIGSDLPDEQWSEKTIDVISSHTNYIFPPACLNSLWGNTTYGRMVMRWASALQWCHDAILKYEKDNNFLFKMVVFTRPDVFIIDRLPVLNQWWDGNTSLHDCYISKHRNPICDDRLWVAPREAAFRLLNTYNTLLKCNVSCPETSNCWTKRGSCCNRNEYALAYSGFPLSPRPPSEYIKKLKYSFIIVRTEKDLLNVGSTGRDKH